MEFVSEPASKFLEDGEGEEDVSSEKQTRKA